MKRFCLLIVFLFSIYSIHAQSNYKYRLIYSSHCDVRRNGVVIDNLIGLELTQDDTLCFYNNSRMDVERLKNGEKDSLIIFVGRFGAKRFGDICYYRPLKKEGWFQRTVSEVKSLFFESASIDAPANTTLYKNEGSNISVSSVPRKISLLINDEDVNVFSDYIDEDAVLVEWHSNEVIVNNISEESWYFDVISVFDGKCYSALSSDVTFVNENYLEPNASVSCPIPPVFRDKDVFLVCSEFPIPYNCVSLDQVEVKDNDIDIKMLIKRIIR